MTAAILDFHFQDGGHFICLIWLFSILPLLFYFALLAGFGLLDCSWPCLCLLLALLPDWIYVWFWTYSRTSLYWIILLFSALFLPALFFLHPWSEFLFCPDCFPILPVLCVIKLFIKDFYWVFVTAVSCIWVLLPAQLDSTIWPIMDSAEALYLPNLLGNLSRTTATHKKQIKDHTKATNELIRSPSSNTSASVTLEPPPAPLFMTLAQEPHLPHPECFSGEPGLCRHFLMQCAFFLEFPRPDGGQPQSANLVWSIWHNRIIYRGLAADVKDELTACELPTELDNLITLDTCFDCRIQ